MINQARGKLVIPNRQIASRPDRSLVKPVNNLTQTQQSLTVPIDSLPATTQNKEVLKTDSSSVATQPIRALPTIPVMQTVAVAPVQPKPLPPAKRVVDSLILPTKPPTPIAIPKETNLEEVTASSQPVANEDIKIINSLNQEPVVKAQSGKGAHDQPNASSKNKKKGYRFFKSKISLGVSVLMIGGLSGAIGYTTWQVAGVFVDDKPSEVAVLGAKTTQTSNQIEVLEVNGNSLRVVSQPTLAFTKDQIVEPSQTLFSQGIFWLDYAVLANLNQQARLTTKGAGRQTDYRYKDTWEIKQLSGVASILPAQKEVVLVSYNQTTDSWSVVIFEQL